MMTDEANPQQPSRNSIPARIEFDHYWYQLVRLLPTHREKLTFLMDILSNEFDPTLGWAQAVVRERLLKDAAKRIRRVQEANHPKPAPSPPGK